MWLNLEMSKFSLKLFRERFQICKIKDPRMICAIHMVVHKEVHVFEFLRFFFLILDESNKNLENLD